MSIILLKKPAATFREAVKKTIDESEALPWPPTIKRACEKKTRNAPDFLKLFHENLLSPASVHHGTSLTAERPIDFFPKTLCMQFLRESS